jgi:hypothetical protein
MRRADRHRGETIPFHIEPAFGQVSENRSEVFVSNEPWDVFQQRPPWSYFAKYPNRFRPEVAFVVCASLLSGDAEWLTRESRRDDIHLSAPGISVKRSHVVPNWKWREMSFVLPLHEHVDAVGVALDGADRSPPEKHASENAATSACEQCQLIHHLNAT